MPLSVIVYPPDEHGARHIRADGEILGRAYSVQDLVVVLEAAGLGFDESEIIRSTLIEWLGGGPDVWAH
ncbi:hypothetical protein ACFYPT_40600 [Streptomyces sp. NPDC005529]|uniref:hypothetical protein n=1 Tax=unclassified Streptomyces TaxID=2593676 RepID=UPI0033B49DB5